MVLQCRELTSSRYDPKPVISCRLNPFAYFQNIQLSKILRLSFEQIINFNGADELWANLQSGNAPNFEFIVPNQCHDMHGFVSCGTPICSSNIAADTRFLMLQADAAVKKLVTGVKARLDR